MYNSHKILLLGNQSNGNVKLIKLMELFYWTQYYKMWKFLK